MNGYKLLAAYNRGRKAWAAQPGNPYPEGSDLAAEFVRGQRDESEYQKRTQEEIDREDVRHEVAGYDFGG